jgi:ribosomal-protein-alanine N-acetyltransferase
MKILEIKPLTAARVTEIVELDRLCIGGLWTEEAYLREIESSRSSLLSLDIFARSSALKTSLKTIGMACLWAIVDEAHITLLAIAPEYRRQGLGELLLLTLLKDAIARKLEWATLEVNVNNFGAINLYKKYGFQVAGTRKGYYQPAGDDASILWLKGIQQSEFQTSLARWQQDNSDRLSENGYCLKQDRSYC